MKNYELLTVFKPNLDLDEVDKAIAKIEENVSNFEGKTLNVDKIGRKRLAYDVLKNRDGFFTTFMMTIPADKITDFKRQLKLNDSILRIMFVEIAKTKVAK